MERELTGDAAATLDPLARGKIDSVVAANEVTLLKLNRRFRERRPATDLLKLTLDEQRELNNEITSATVKDGDAYLAALQEVFHDPEEYESRARESNSIFANVALSRWRRLTDGMAFETVTSHYDAEIEGVSHEPYFQVLTELRDRVERRVLEMWERYSASQADFDKTAADLPHLLGRHAMRRMSMEELVHGPGNSRPPSMSGPWQMVSAKTDGVTPGFQIKDATGTRYLLKLDSRNFSELATAADTIGSKSFYAFGYNTPENYIVRFRSDQLVYDQNTKLKVHGRGRPLTRRSFEELLHGQPVDSEGRYRAMASRFIEGKILGQFRYYGTRFHQTSGGQADHAASAVWCPWVGTRQVIVITYILHL